MESVDPDRTIFALICPDALARHLGRVILARVGEAGFAPVAWRVIWHRPEDLDFFHERNISSAWQSYLYRLVDQLFAFGPAVALLLADQRPGMEGHSRLRLAKGPSDPARSGPGTIRGDLGSVNGMLSLLHTADSAADSARESAVFTGPDGFTSGDQDDLLNVLELLELQPASRNPRLPGRGSRPASQSSRGRLARLAKTGPQDRERASQVRNGGTGRARERRAARLPA